MSDFNFDSVEIYGHCYHTQTFEEITTQDRFEMLHYLYGENKVDEFLDGNFVIILRGEKEKRCITGSYGLPAFFYVKDDKGDLDFVVIPSDERFLESKPKPNKEFLDIVKETEKFSHVYHNSHSYIPCQNTNMYNKEVHKFWYMTPIKNCFLLPPNCTIIIKDKKIQVKLNIHIKSSLHNDKDYDPNNLNLRFRNLMKLCSTMGKNKQQSDSTLFLSGGLDSRAILSVLLNVNNCPSLCLVNKEGEDFLKILSSSYIFNERDQFDRLKRQPKIFISNNTNNNDKQTFVEKMIKEKRTFGLGNPYKEFNFLNSIHRNQYMNNGSRKFIHGFNENILKMTIYQLHKKHYGDYSDNAFNIQKGITHLSGELGSLGTFIVSTGNKLITPFLVSPHLLVYSEEYYKNSMNDLVWRKVRTEALRFIISNNFPDLLNIPIISNTEGALFLYKIFESDPIRIKDYVQKDYLDELDSLTPRNSKSTFTQMFMDMISDWS